MIPDISQFQGFVNWDALQASNPEAVIIRAGYGVGGRDAQFQRNWSEARARNIKRIAYWFCYPAYNSPEAEATDFNSQVPPLQPGEGMAADFEDDPNALGWNNVANPFDWARRFLTNMGGPSYVGGWYSSPAFIRQHGLANLADTWWMWIANWFVSSPDTVGKKGSLWQFTDCASVPGVSGCCDASYPLVPVDSLLMGGSAPAPVGGVMQHITIDNPVSGKVLAGAAWYNWGDAVNGNLVAVGGSPALGDTLQYKEAVQFNDGRWFDRILTATGPGSWCVPDANLDTLDVSGCLDPAACKVKFANPPPAPAPPPAPVPPPTPPPPAPVDFQPQMDALKTQLTTLNAKVDALAATVAALQAIEQKIKADL